MFTTAELIQAYSRDPINKYCMENASTSYLQKNTVCGDEIEVFLMLQHSDWSIISSEKDISGFSNENIIIKERSREWSPAIQTIAAASMLAEVIEWKTISKVMSRDYQFMKDLWLDMSPRRRRSAVTALLGTINAVLEKTDKDVLRYSELI